MGFDELEEEFLDGVAENGDGTLTPVSIHGLSAEERKKRRDIMDKRTGRDQERQWTQEDREALAQAEALAAPPIINNPQCQVCQSEHRVWIERKLVQGHSYASISRSIPDGSVSRKSIANHWKEHMALDQAAVRAILEEEAAGLGQNLEEGVRGAFTLRGAVEILIRKGFQDAQDGLTTVEPRDMIQLVKLLNDLNTGSAATATEQARTAIAIFKEAIQNVLLKGDVVSRELGIQILEAIAQEVETLKAAQEVEATVDRHLQLPAGE